MTSTCREQYLESNSKSYNGMLYSLQSLPCGDVVVVLGSTVVVSGGVVVPVTTVVAGGVVVPVTTVVAGGVVVPVTTVVAGGVSIRKRQTHKTLCQNMSYDNSCFVHCITSANNYLNVILHG